jgi:hypothetical protein
VKGTVVNKNGKTVSDPINGVSDGILVSFDKDFTASLVDLEGDTSWPYSGFTYLLLQTRTFDRCAERRELMKFLLFNLQDSNVRKSNNDAFFTNLPFSIISQVKEKLLNVTCDGKAVARYILIRQHPGYNNFLLNIF